MQGQILGLVSAVGLILFIACANLAVLRVLRTELYGIGECDPLILTMVPLTLILSASRVVCLLGASAESVPNAPHRIGPDRVTSDLFGFRNAKQSSGNFAFISGTICLTRGGESVAPDDCPQCGGSGYIAKPVDLNGKSEGVAFIRIKCPACGGSGRKRPISPTAAG
jgi:hypothetical protein